MITGLVPDWLSMVLGAEVWAAPTNRFVACMGREWGGDGRLWPPACPSVGCFSSARLPRLGAR